MPTPTTAERLVDTIGRTPVVQLARVAGGADVRVKLEIRSPTGCFCDRVAAELLSGARPARGDELLEGGDGVFAVALAAAARELGARLRAFVPESSSLEVRQSLQALGAAVELTPHEEGPRGALARARAHGPLARDSAPAAMVRAASAWVMELAPLIEADGGKCDALAVADEWGALAQALGSLPFQPGAPAVQVSHGIRVLGSLPFEAQVLAPCVDDARAAHRLAGLPYRAQVPERARALVIDDAFGWTWRERLAREEGLLLSPAAAATVGVAVEHAAANPGARVYAVASDTGERYFSLKDTFTWKS